MRRILVLVFVLLSIQGFAQPSNYSWYKQRTRQYSFMADSAMYLPRYNGTPSGVRSNESSTISGMVGIDTTNHRQYFRSGSSWRRLANYTELGVDSIWRVAGTDSIFWSKQGNNYAIKDSAGGASTIPISSLTAATVDNLIDNTTYRQWWRWTNGLSSGTAGLVLQASTNAASSNSQRLLHVSLSGANTNSGQRTHSAIFENIHTGTSSTNVATYSYTSSGTTNIGSESYSNGGTTSYGVVGYALSGTTNIGGQFYAAGGTTNIALDLGYAGSYLGNMRMNGSTSGAITIQPAAAAGTYTLTLPTTDGNSGEFLQTDGSGVLTWAAASGGSPAGNFGNLQINRNGAFATPGSDSLDWESATGLTVTGGTRTTTLGVNKAAPTATYAAEIASDGTYTTNLKLSNTGTPTSFFTLNSVYGDVLSVGSLFKGSEFLISQSDGIFGISQGSNQIARFTANDGMYAGRRWQTKQGADVASAAGAITLGGDGNVFEITGTSSITLIANTNWQNGATVTLLFTSTATLTDGTANSGSNIGMELAGNANFTATADDVLTLVLSEIGGTQRWREVSRSVN